MPRRPRSTPNSSTKFIECGRELLELPETFELVLGPACVGAAFAPPGRLFLANVKMPPREATFVVSPLESGERDFFPARAAAALPFVVVLGFEGACCGLFSRNLEEDPESEGHEEHEEEVMWASIGLLGGASFPPLLHDLALVLTTRQIPYYQAEQTPYVPPSPLSLSYPHTHA